MARMEVLQGPKLLGLSLEGPPNGVSWRICYPYKWRICYPYKDRRPRLVAFKTVVCYCRDMGGQDIQGGWAKADRVLVPEQPRT